MAAKCSIAPAAIWNWVIEALASFEQADISTLIGLVKMNAEISGDLGKDAREMVSLRILESLFVHSNEAIVDGDSAQNAKISFDASECCAKVLRKIVRKTPDVMANVEKEKWDVRPFLVHKRSSLPKCMLKKLKEAILENSHPLLASLKESSKLIIANTSENCDVQNTVAKNDIAFLNPRKDENKNQEKMLQEADQVGNSTEGTTEHSGREECEMFIGRPVEGSSGNKLTEQDDRLETVNNSDRADDKRTDIASKYKVFLNSHCMLNQNSLAGIEWAEIGLCMKCNEGGQLLVCSSDACPIRVHESCLGSAVTLDDNGKFFCPFCVYSRAISEYRDAERKASLARKDLQVFSYFTVVHTSNKSTEKQSEMEKNGDRQIGAFDETIEENVNQIAASGANNINCMSNEEDSAQADLLIPVANDDPTCGEKGAAVPVTSAENVGEGFQSRTEMISLQAVNDHGYKHPCFNGNENDLVTCEHADMHIRNGGLTLQTAALPHNPIPKASMPKEKCKKKEIHRSIEFSCSRNLCKRKAQYIPPAVPLTRRKVVPWTKTEEETLKEGVQRCSSVNYRGIPWKEILDFGCNVFQKGRTPIDLKDKWRNICKGSPNVK